MAENHENETPKEARNPEIDREIDRIRQKRVEPDAPASRGRFIAAGVFIAVLLYLGTVFLPTKAPEPAPSVPQPVVQVETPPMPAPVTEVPELPPVPPRQYEEAIGPPVPPVTPRLIKRKEGELARVAIVIDDCGISSVQTMPVLELPKAVTLAFLPYGHATKKMAAQAFERGHDVMLHMPMQPLGRENPGPQPVTPGLPAEDIKQRVSDALAAVPYAIGVNNHMGSAATADTPAMQAVMETLQGKEVFFLDSYTNSRSVAYKTALANGLNATRRDVFLDDTISTAAIAFELERLEKVAHKQGYAIAIGHPHPATLDALKNWLPSLSERGLELVPVKTLTTRIEQ